jgi:hypothetical protein
MQVEKEKKPLISEGLEVMLVRLYLALAGDMAVVRDIDDLLKCS